MYEEKGAGSWGFDCTASQLCGPGQVHGPRQPCFHICLWGYRHLSRGFDQTSNYRSSAWDRVGAQLLGAVIVVITQMITIKCKSVTITDPFFLPKLVSALVMLFVVSQVL